MEQLSSVCQSLKEDIDSVGQKSDPINFCGSKCNTVYYFIKITQGVRNDGHFTHKLLMSEMVAGDVNNLAMYFFLFFFYIEHQYV